MSAGFCFVVLDHLNDEFFDDLVAGIRTLCPEADIVWYDSGPASQDRDLGDPLRLACSRPLEYAKVTPFFFDMFEWAADHAYEYVVNVESDMAFIASGFKPFLDCAMDGVDYLAPGFARNTARTSQWRPYRSLRPELPELVDILGTDHTNRGFSPGQVFSARYIHTLLDSPVYPPLRAFVERNQRPGRSFTLQEVLLPTLPDVLGLTVQDYPEHMARYNRYRPFHSVQAVHTAHTRGDVHFVHPVRRDPQHAARQYVRTLCQPSRIRKG